MIKFENPVNKRFYYLKKEIDMLGDHVLTIIRGGRNARIVRHYGYKCVDKINSEIEKISKIRLTRGYVDVS